MVEDLPVNLIHHRRSDGVSVGGREALGVAGMDELGVRPVAHAPCYEVDNRNLGLTGTGRYVDDQALGLSDYHPLQCVANRLVVGCWHHVRTLASAEHGLRERQ